MTFCVSSLESDFLRLLNASRAAAGLKPLAQAGAAGCAARRHAEDCDRTDRYSHTGSDSSTVGTRLAACGYTSTGYRGETLCANAWLDTAQEALDEFRRSALHWAALHSARYVAAGVGHSSGLGGRYGHYWVVVLVAPGAPAAPMCEEK